MSDGLGAVLILVLLASIVAAAKIIVERNKERRRATCDHEWVEIEVERFERGAKHGYNERWQRRGVEPGVECPLCGVFEAKSPIQWEEWKAVPYVRK